MLIPPMNPDDKPREVLPFEFDSQGNLIPDGTQSVDISTQRYMEVLIGARTKQEHVVKGPLKWPGAKNRILEWLMPQIPYRDAFIDVFGGSGVVMINRRPSKVDVYNDRYDTLVDLFKAIRDHPSELIQYLSDTYYSREIFEDSIVIKQSDPVWVRGAQVLFRMGFSVFGMGDVFNTPRPPYGEKFDSAARNHLRKISHILELSDRFRGVVLENLDWREVLRHYDSPMTVFYLDPPYYKADWGKYEFSMSPQDHEEMLNLVFKLDACVCVSSYPNELYSKYPWTKRTVTTRYMGIDAHDTFVGEALYTKEALVKHQ